MTSTLNHDEFEDEPIEHNYEAHSILYGKTGWTDEVDEETIALLVNIGAIRLDRTHSGIGWETRVYVSAKGSM